MADLDRLLDPGVSRAAAEAVRTPDFDLVERRGVRRRRRQGLLAVAAAAVVVVVGAAAATHVLGTDDARPPVVGQPHQRLMPTGDASLQPGTYRVHASRWSAADFTVTVPRGWVVRQGSLFRKHPDRRSEVTVESFAVDEIYADACRGQNGPSVSVGPGPGALVAALLAQPGVARGEPVSTTVGGYPATRIDLRVPRKWSDEGCSLRPSTGRQVWHSDPTGYLVVDSLGATSVYVVDVEGERQVFATDYHSRASTADRAELRQVLSSIRILGAPPPGS